MTIRKDKTASMETETALHAQGFIHIIGLDEAGYGAWAGPVAAGAVCLPPSNPDLLQALAGVRDSKDMTRLQRESLSDKIKHVAITWGIGQGTQEEIDSLGLRAATRLALIRALEQAIQRVDGFTPDCLLVDGLGVKPPIYDCYTQNIKRGDSLSLSIAAASVLAKVWRDAYMMHLDDELPHYGFRQHKGYGTAKHHAALLEHGVSSIHRRSYRPIQQILNGDS
jgi:ribonuclease HII